MNLLPHNLGGNGQQTTMQLKTKPSMGLDRIHPRVLRKLVEDPIKPLSVMEFPGHWKWANVTLSCKKGWNEKLESYRHVNLTALSVKVMEKSLIILSAIM